MKKLISILLFSSFAIVTFAQYTNSMNKEQLQFALTKAQSMKSTGGVLCVLGGIGLITGAALYISGLSSMASNDNISNIDKDLTKSLTGVAVGVVGVVGLGIGIPFAVIGGHKKNNIEIALMKFKGSASINGIGFRVRF